MAPPLIVDAQLHEPGPRLEWNDHDPETQEMLLSELTFAWMDAAGIDAAILFPLNEGWAARFATQFPHRIATVPRIDRSAPDIDTAVAEVKDRHSAGVLALRALIAYPPSGEEVERFKAGAYEAAFAACERHQVPVFLFVTGWLPLANDIAERYPDLQLIIDHFGIPQPPAGRDDPPFRQLPDLLSLAKYPNVAVKFCGAPSLSEVSYPHSDLWPNLEQVLEAFGPERLMWATDITRFHGRIGLGYRDPKAESGYPGKHTYAEALHFISDTDQLSESDKEWILGGTVRRLLQWPQVRA
jgi:predicted TIM-barrel fold metal-dependent hydrolase